MSLAYKTGEKRLMGLGVVRLSSYCLLVIILFSEKLLQALAHSVVDLHSDYCCSELRQQR